MGRGSSRTAKHARAPFKLPDAERPFGGELVVDCKCAVYFGRIEPNCWWEHSHPQTQLKVLIDARGFLSFRTASGRRITIPLNGSYVWIVPPGRRHALRLVDRAEVIAVYLEPALADEATVQPLREPSLAPLGHYVREDRMIADLIAMFRSKLRRPHPSPHQRPNYLAMNGGILGYRLLAAHFAPRQRETNAESGLLEPVLLHLFDYIDVNLAQPLTRDILAREAGISPWHFGRLFKMSTGKSPARFVSELRIDRAKELLARGDRTVSGVAIDVGLAYSQLAFHFQRRFGVTPSAFRQNLKSAQNRRL